MPDTWERNRAAVEPFAAIRPRFKTVIVVRSEDAVDRLRVGLWADEVRVVGYELPFVPEHSTVTIDSVDRRVYIDNDSGHEIARNYASGWGAPISFASIPQGAYTLTVDQLAEHAVPVRVEVHIVQTAGR